VHSAQNVIPLTLRMQRLLLKKLNSAPSRNGGVEKFCSRGVGEGKGNEIQYNGASKGGWLNPALERNTMFWGDKGPGPRVGPRGRQELSKNGRFAGEGRRG